MPDVSPFSEANPAVTSLLHLILSCGSLNLNLFDLPNQSSDSLPCLMDRLKMRVSLSDRTI